MPASSRCVGWDAINGRTLCGEGYEGTRCSRCAKSFYSDSSTGGECRRCPSASSSAESIIVAAVTLSVIVGGIAALALLLGGVAAFLTVRAGGKCSGALPRVTAFAMATFVSLQAVAQVAQQAPTDSAPFVRGVFSGFRALQLQGVSPTPFACTSISPLLFPQLALAAAMALAGLWSAASCCWFASLRVRARMREQASAASAAAADAGQANGDAALALPISAAATEGASPVLSSSPPSHTIGSRRRTSAESNRGSTCSRTRTAFDEALARIWTRLPWLGSVGGTVLTLLHLAFGLLSNTAVDLVACATATVTLSQYRVLPGADGSTVAAAFGITPAQALDPAYTVQTATGAGDPLVSLRLLSAYPGVVCGEGAQPQAQAIATAALIVLIAGLPIGTYLFMRYAAVPAVLQISPVPLSLLMQGAPHICYGGLLTDSVLSRERGAEAGRGAALRAWDVWDADEMDDGDEGASSNGAAAATVAAQMQSWLCRFCCPCTRRGAAAAAAARRPRRPVTTLAPSQVSELELATLLRKQASARRALFAELVQGRLRVVNEGAAGSAAGTAAASKRSGNAGAGAQKVDGKAAPEDDDDDEAWETGESGAQADAQAQVKQQRLSRFTAALLRFRVAYPWLTSPSYGDRFLPQGMPSLPPSLVLMYPSSWAAADMHLSLAAADASAGGAAGVAAAPSAASASSASPGYGSSAESSSPTATIKNPLASKRFENPLAVAAGAQAIPAVATSGASTAASIASPAALQPISITLSGSASAAAAAASRTASRTKISGGVTTSSSSSSAAGGGRRRQLKPAAPVQEAPSPAAGPAARAAELATLAKREAAAVELTAVKLRPVLKTGSSIDGASDHGGDAAGSGSKSPGIAPARSAVASTASAASSGSASKGSKSNGKRLAYAVLSDGSVVTTAIMRGVTGASGKAGGGTSSTDASASTGESEDEDPLIEGAVVVPRFGFTCCCLRSYSRLAQTSDDVVDSSESLRKRTPLIGLFTSGTNVRASAFAFVQGNWALLAVLAGLRAASAVAGTAASATVGSESSMAAARASVTRSLAGLLSALACLAFAAHQVFAMPDAPALQWRLPVRLLTLLLAALTAIYQALSANRVAGADPPGSVPPSSSESALGVVVAVLAIGLVPVLITVFAASLLTGARQEKEEVTAQTEAREEVRTQMTAVIAAAEEAGKPLDVAALLSNPLGMAPSAARWTGIVAAGGGVRAPPRSERTARYGGSQHLFGVQLRKISRRWGGQFGGASKRGYGANAGLNLDDDTPIRVSERVQRFEDVAARIAASSTGSATAASPFPGHDGDFETGAAGTTPRPVSMRPASVGSAVQPSQSPQPRPHRGSVRIMIAEDDHGNDSSGSSSIASARASISNTSSGPGPGPGPGTAGGSAAASAAGDRAAAAPVRPKSSRS